MTGGMVGERGDEGARQAAEQAVELVGDAPPDVLGRTVLAVAAMHEPDRWGRCRYCRAERRGWRARRAAVWPCPTRRVIVAELRTGAGPRWWSA